MNRQYAHVLIPLALEHPYTYLVPEDLHLAEGDFVQIPLGARNVTGVIWSLTDKTADEPQKLRRIITRLNALPLPAAMRKFIDWVAAYTLAPKGLVLKMAMSVPAALGPEKTQIHYRLTSTKPERSTPARRRILALMSDGLARRASEISHLAGTSASVVKGLAGQGVLEKIAMPAHPPSKAPDPAAPGHELSADQAAAARRIREELLEPGTHRTALLDGVTGSGKTEVYFESLAQVLKSGKQVLVLLPEIALTAQFLKRFEARFGAAPALWHSAISPGRRERTWRGIIKGGIKIIAGARSALFLPFSDLGLIIVDEEHESAFKQEDGVSYHGRDMAVLRAYLSDIPIILSTATPSVETLNNARNGKYRHILLPARHGGAKLPVIRTVDMRDNPPQKQKWLSPALIEAASQTLQRGEQVMLFLNRRGYAPLTLCRSCGHRMACPNCQAWLVEHRYKERLLCHHCGFSAKTPQACPACAAPGSLTACGPGIERVAEEAAAIFPQYSLALLSSDLDGGIKKMHRLFAEIEAGKIDIIIGTQLVAKGHHFPNLTLVGVVDGDLGLAHGDMRAGERTYQLLHQVAGRAGRAQAPGQALIQTYEPENPVMAALTSGNRELFYDREIELRRLAALPPFGHLAGIVISGKKESLVTSFARNLARGAPMQDGIRVLGPAPAPLGFLRGRYRYRFLLKSKTGVPLQGFIRKWLESNRPRHGIRIHIDIDPQSFL